jgi:O-antigen ligase
MEATLQPPRETAYTGYLRSAMFGLLVVALVGLVFSIAVSSIAFGGAMVLWIALLCTRSPNAFPRLPIDWIIVAYIVVHYTSTLFSSDHAQALLYSKRILLLAYAYLIVALVDSRKKLQILLVAVVGALILSSLFEVGQTVIQASFNRRLEFFQHYMTEGGMKMFAILLIVPFLISPKVPKKVRWYALAAALPIALTLVLTQTRSSWLGVSAGIMFLTLFRNKKVFFIFVAIVMVAFFLAPPFLQHRAASSFEPNNVDNLSRVRMLETGWKIFLEHPLIGIGDIDVRTTYVQTLGFTPPDPAEGGHLHSNFMQILVTLGIVGFVVLFLLFYKIFTFELRAYRDCANDWLSGSICLGALACFVGFHINGLFEFNFGDHEIAALLWFTFGMSIAARRLAIANPHG